MNSLKEIISELENLGNPSTKKIFFKHGAREPFFGVKVGDLKKIVKRIKKDHNLSLQLYATGNSDAMYLAGLLADESKITKDQLDMWAQQAYWYMLSEYAVAWITADSKHGWELSKQWMNSPKEMVCGAGWATLSNLLATKPDEDIDMDYIKERLDYVASSVHQAQNRVKYTMNGVVIAVGAYVPALTKYALRVAKIIGKVAVEVGETSCKVPLAEDYIRKIINMNRVGKKKKMARC